MASEPETMHVRLAGSYDFDRFERMVEAVQPLLWMQEPAAVHLDLGGLVFIGPTSLALLEAVINDLARKSFLAVGGQLILPRNEMTRNYLHRMDFFSASMRLSRSMSLSHVAQRSDFSRACASGRWMSCPP